MIKDKVLFEMKMVERGYTYGKLASAIGCSVTTLNQKVNHDIDFRLWETERLADVLDLTLEEYLSIFIRKKF